MRSVTISPAGVPAAPVTVGRGGFGRDTVRAAPDGTLAACCVHPVVSDPNVPPDTTTRLALHRPGAGWSLVPLGALGEADAVETVYATQTDLARAGAGGILGAPLRAPVDSPGRGLSAHVTIDGSGRSVLLFQEKARPQAFSRTAPVYATVAPANATALPRARQRLTAAQGYEPAVRPLGPGAIGVWQAPRRRWGVAIERDGVFRPAPAPPGPGPSGLGEDFAYAYDLQAAGTHAVLAWVAADGSVRVSELR